MARGDVGLVRKLISSQRGVLAFGTDPNEWWEGAGTIGAKFEAQLEAMGGRMEVVHGAPHADKEGSVGWASDRTASMAAGGWDRGPIPPYRCLPQRGRRLEDGPGSHLGRRSEREHSGEGPADLAGVFATAADLLGGAAPGQ